MSLGCPECGSLRTGSHSPLCTWRKRHPTIASMTAEGCVIDRDWAIAQIMRVLEKFSALEINKTTMLPLASEAVDSLVISHLPTLGDERVRQLRQSIRSIADACVAGKVCDDIAWMDDTTTLFDYCEQALDYDLIFEGELQASQSRLAAVNAPMLGDTSFPFLQIARAFGVEYGDVVRCANSFEKRVGDRNDDREVASYKTIMALPNSGHIMAAIDTAMQKEQARRHG